jgi:shikimate kinase
MNIYLTGYRATGKSTVAALVARELGWSWLDTDELVETAAGMSIAEIFSRQGEAGFRQREQQAISQASSLDGQVVALGGGAIIDEANRELLQGTGPIVWLTASVATILARLETDPATSSRRPALSQQGTREEIEQLLDERTPVYEESADLVIATDQLTPRQVADQVVCWLEDRQ